MKEYWTISVRLLAYHPVLDLDLIPLGLQILQCDQTYSRNMLLTPFYAVREVTMTEVPVYLTETHGQESSPEVAFCAERA